MAKNQAECLIGSDRTQGDHRHFGSAVLIARYQEVGFEDFGPFQRLDARRSHVTLPIGSHLTADAMVDTLVYPPPGQSPSISSLKSTFAQAYAALRWGGLLCIEVLLIPFSGSKPMKNSVMHPMAIRLANRWTRK